MPRGLYSVYSLIWPGAVYIGMTGTSVGQRLASHKSRGGAALSEQFALHGDPAVRVIESGLGRDEAAELEARLIRATRSVIGSMLLNS